jgi:hypothetical protein
MHYHAEIWIKTIEDRDEHEIEDMVETIMSPYQEEYGSGSEHFWDWYEVGGRWSHGKNNITPVSMLPSLDEIDSFTCATLITETGYIYHDQLWTGDAFIPNPAFNGRVLPKLKQLGIEDGYLITVDYHC